MIYGMQDGKKIKIGFNPFAKGYTPEQLTDTYYKLTCEPKQQLLILESVSMDEMEAEYGGGEVMCDTGCLNDCARCNPDRENGMVMESVRVRSFSRTAQTMTALARSLNRYMADKGLTVGEATIGKPRKSGLFATVTVQFPVSDGQTITIVFHSPDNNKLQITAADEILAFRWLLNKRDITVAVSPEGEADVSLEEVGKRVAMLVEKNAKAFASKSKDIADQKQALADVQGQVAAVQAEHETLMATLVETEAQSEKLDGEIQAATQQLTKVQEFNADLQAQVDALAATVAGNKGKAGGESTKTPEQIQAEADAAEFEAKKSTFEGELSGRGFAKETINEMDQFRGPGQLFASLDGPDRTGGVYRIAAWDESQGDLAPTKFFDTKALAGFDKQSVAALAWIDKKLAGMKAPEAEVVDPLKLAINQAVADPITHQIWTLPTEEIKALPSDDFSSAYEILEDNNYHTENVIMDAKRGGTEQDVADAEHIKRIADAEGSVSPLLNAWREALRKWLAGTGEQAELDAAKSAALGTDTKIDTEPDRAEEDDAVTILNSIIAGEYADSGSISDALDQAASMLEAEGLMDLYDDRLNAAADYLTTILAQEAK